MNTSTSIVSVWPSWDKEVIVIVTVPTLWVEIKPFKSTVAIDSSLDANLTLCSPALAGVNAHCNWYVSYNPISVTLFVISIFVTGFFSSQIALWIPLALAINTVLPCLSSQPTKLYPSLTGDGNSAPFSNVTVKLYWFFNNSACSYGNEKSGEKVEKLAL